MHEDSLQPDTAAVEIELPSLQATESLGVWLGAQLFAGAVVGLIGPLGAGKTHLVRAIARGLGCDERLVSSPTFVLLQEYPGRLPIYHFDTYRLPDAQAFADLGVEEYLEGEGACLIEWADRVRGCLPPAHLHIVLEIAGEEMRRARLEATGNRYCEMIDRWKRQCG